MTLSQGARLGPYETLGAGGMGRVFRARDVKLDRPVAHLSSGHYVVIHELGETGVAVGDPEMGIVNWSAEYLGQCYSGALLLFDLPRASG